MVWMVVAAKDWMLLVEGFLRIEIRGFLAVLEESDFRVYAVSKKMIQDSADSSLSILSLSSIEW